MKASQRQTLTYLLEWSEETKFSNIMTPGANVIKQYIGKLPPKF
jgi:hypothetical protein